LHKNQLLDEGIMDPSKKAMARNLQEGGPPSKIDGSICKLALEMIGKEEELSRVPDVSQTLSSFFPI
jgi:hypothetical protein